MRAGLALAIGALGFGLRWRAVERLPVEPDEVVYLEAADGLAGVLRAHDWEALTQTNWRHEHPQLAKGSFALAVLAAPESRPSPARGSLWGGASPVPEAKLVAARTTAAAFGALAVLLLAWLQPLAGFFLALQGATLKYTSLVMLEALPAFTSLACVACHVRAKRTGAARWHAASAALLGVTAAGKYVYAIVGLAVLADWWLERRARRRGLAAQLGPLLAWGTGALLVFFAACPYLWPDPLWRLRESVLFHGAFSGSSHVTSWDFPFWQPLVWLTAPGALRPDLGIALLALAGAGRLWREQRVFAIWLVVALVFLLVWSTKWPQYVLIVTAPLCLAASEGACALAGAAARRLRARRGEAPA